MIGILLIAIFIVGPELGRTLGNLMQSIPVFFQETQKWAEDVYKRQGMPKSDHTENQRVGKRAYVKRDTSLAYAYTLHL